MDLLGVFCWARFASLRLPYIFCQVGGRVWGSLERKGCRLSMEYGRRGRRSQAIRKRNKKCKDIGPWFYWWLRWCTAGGSCERGKFFSSFPFLFLSKRTYISSQKEDAEAAEWNKYSSPKELESLGLEALKAELLKRDLKCGGTAAQRAERLWDNIKGISKAKPVPAPQPPQPTSTG